MLELKFIYLFLFVFLFLFILDNVNCLFIEEAVMVASTVMNLKTKHSSSNANYYKLNQLSINEITLRETHPKYYQQKKLLKRNNKLNN